MSKYLVPEGFLLAFFTIVFLSVLFTFSGWGSVVGLAVVGALIYFDYKLLRKKVG